MKASPASPPTIPTFQCPEAGHNTGARTGAEISEGVMSWSACSLKCAERAGACRYWTWHHSQAGQFSHRCVTMTDALYKVEDSNAVSATKHCVCPLVGQNTRTRSQAHTVDDVGSWESCAQLCRDSTLCTYWTWHHQDAGPFALRCVLMAGYAELVRDNNALSGPPQCSSSFHQ